MLFLLVGLVMLALWWAGIEPVAHWPWWALLTPFGLTVVWWMIADALGMTQRRAMKQMDERKLQRRLRSLDALGLGFLKGRARDEHKRGFRPRPPAETTRHDSKY